jgi:hypothetical protein
LSGSPAEADEHTAFALEHRPEPAPELVADAILKA